MTEYGYKIQSLDFSQDEFQIFVTGIALGLRKPSQIRIGSSDTVRKHGDDDMMFKLEEEHTIDLRENATNATKVMNKTILFRIPDVCTFNLITGGR